MKHVKSIKNPFSQLVADKAIDIVYKITNSDFFVTGSVRRGSTIVNDLDLLVHNNDYDKFFNISKDHECIKEILTHGNKTMRWALIVDDYLVQVDIKRYNDEDLPSMMLHYTGNIYLNIAMRSVAKKYGYKLNEYGLFENDKRIDVKSEEDIFSKLGLNYITPGERSCTSVDEAFKLIKLYKR